MASTQNVYSLKNVTAFLGVIPIIGFGPEASDHIVITMKQDRINQMVGSDGKNNIINVSADATAEVEVKLLPNSPTNAFFTAQFNLLTGALQTPGLPLLISNTNFPELFVGQNAAISSMPIVNYGSDAEVYVWKILVSNAVLLLTGSL